MTLRILAAVILCLNITNGADWSVSKIVKLSQDMLLKRHIPCVALMYPGSQPSSEITLISKKLHNVNSQEFYMTKTMPITKSGNDAMWDECAHLLCILPAWQDNAKSEFKTVMDIAEEMKSTWLVFLPKGLTTQEFIGETDVPFTARVLTISPSLTNYALNEVWRVSVGYPLRMAFWATWSEEKGLACGNDMCRYYYRKDLEGFPVRAATKEDMPISRLKQLNNGTLALDGYFGDIYYVLLDRLNGTAAVLQASENTTGSATRGQWSGLVGMMQRNEIDLAVGPISFNRAVVDVANYLKPLLRTNYQVFFKQSGTEFEWDTILKPFALYVWLLILLWIIVGTLCLNHFYRVGVMSGREDASYSWEYSKCNSLFTFLRALSAQGTNLMPMTMSCRILYLTGYLSFSVLLTAYSAALISNLTTQQPMRPFDSLESFLKEGTYKITAIGRSTDYTYFSEATDKTLQDIYEKQMMRENLPTGKEEGLMQVCDGDKMALFITFAVTQISARQISISKKCPILHFKTPLGIVYMSIGIRKRMPFSSLFTHEIQEMAEKGILKRLQGREWPLPSTANAVQTSQAVEIGQVVQVYSVLLVGILLSILILIFEKLHAYLHRFENRRRNYRDFPADYGGTAVIAFSGVVLLGLVVVGYSNQNSD